MQKELKADSSQTLRMTKELTSPQPFRVNLFTLTNRNEQDKASPVGEGVKFPPLEGRTKEGSLDTAHDRLLRMIRGLTPPLPFRENLQGKPSPKRRGSYRGPLPRSE